MGRYEAIFFDMGETLVYHHPTHEEVFFTVLEQVGWSFSQPERLVGMRWAREAMSRYDARLREDGVSLKDLENDFFQEYLNALGIEPVTPDLIRQVKAGRAAMKQAMVCPPHVPELLGELRQQGYHLGIVSNWDDTLRRHCDEHGLSPYFNGIYASMLVGSSKPDAGIFRHALAKAGVAPDRALHIGDNYYADVLGARAAGLDAILLDQHQLHPEADCPVMTSLGELRNFL